MAPNLAKKILLRPHVSGALAAAMAGTLFGTGSANAAPLVEGRPVIENRSIGYVMTHRFWGIVESEGGKKECPQGFNDGPREQFKKLFPDGKQRTVLDTQLKREGEQWHPETSTDRFPFHEAKGTIAYGLNLDGKIDKNDFESPEGEPGIDNELYRVIGCVANYRIGGTFSHFENLYMGTYNDNRFVIEITDVDDLVNDDDVTVTTYRGLDRILNDATGSNFLSGGTQRLDLRWGKDFIQSFKGRIVDGVLTTEPNAEPHKWQWAATFDVNGYQLFHDLRFKLKLLPESAEGVMAGYVDVEHFTDHMNTSWSTHHQSYGQTSSPSVHRALRRLADGVPDPETGINRGISAAVNVRFTQVFISRGEGAVTAQRR